VRDWLYVVDNCRAIDLVLRKGKKGEVYNIGGSNERTNLEITMEILRLMGHSGADAEKQIERVKDRLGHDRRYSVDSTKVSKLGWKPQITLDEGLKQTVEWYVRNEWWWKPLLAKQG